MKNDEAGNLFRSFLCKEMTRIAAVEIPNKLMEILYGYLREICKFRCCNVKIPVLVLTYHSVSLLLAETNLLICCHWTTQNLLALLLVLRCSQAWRTDRCWNEQR